MTHFKHRVAPLTDLDEFEVAEGDPDVRGWKVIGSEEREIGKVAELLVDTGAMRVRYLDVNVKDDLLDDADRNRHILVPIGFARLDPDHKRVLVDELTNEQIRNLPPYARKPLTRDYEVSVIRTYDPSYSSEGGFYEHMHYDDERFYGSRD